MPITNVRVEATVAGLGTLSGFIDSIPAGNLTYPIAVSANAGLPGGTQIYDPMTISWKVGLFDTCNRSCTQFACQVAGTSSSTVYVTMATPPASLRPLPLTTLGLAVAGGGAASPNAAFQNTWSRFSSNGAGPANVTTWDNRLLYYYTAGQKFDACATNSSLLLNVRAGYGQCGSFMFLFHDALLVNGINVDLIRVDTPNLDQFLVKSWIFLGAGDSTYVPYSWPLALELESVDSQGGAIYGMVPLPVGSIFGSLVSENTLAGQNSAPPSEKVFGAHFIVRDTLGVSGTVQYYDPSYGVSYSNECDPVNGFEVKAVDGYVRQLANVDPNGSYHVRTKDSKSCNIRFSTY